MKKAILMLAALLLMVVSCRKNETPNPETSTSDTIAVDQPEIIIDSVTNKEGVTLKMKFDNANETAVFELNGQTIETKQERMGSGIKYSNKQYEFSEHQGDIEVKKDGKTIYSYQE